MKSSHLLLINLFFLIFNTSFAQEIKVFSKGKKYGYKKDRKVLVEPIYDFAYEFSQGRGLVVKDKLYGYYDENGVLVIPLKYSAGSPFINGLAPVDSAEYSTMIDVNGQKKFPFKYEYITVLTDGYFKVESKRRYGIINLEGKEIARCIYKEIMLLDKNWVKVRDRYGNDVEAKTGLVRLSDGLTVPMKYCEIDNFSQGVAACSVYDESSKSYLWGYIDSLGNEIVRPIYEQVTEFKNGIGSGFKKGNTYYFDKQGENPYSNKLSIHLSEGLAAKKMEGKFGYVDNNSNMVIPAQFDDAWKFKNGLARVRSNGKFGFINKAGQVIIPIKYEDTGFPDEKGVWVKDNGKYTYLDLNGKELIPAEFEDVLYKGFVNGIAKVKLAGREWGFIDLNGNAINPPDSLIKTLTADKNLVPFKADNGFYGYKENDKIVIPARYDFAGPFNNGIALIRHGDEETGLRGAIDRFGNDVIPARYEYLDIFDSGLAPAQASGTFGYIDLNNRFVIEKRYDIAMSFDNNRAIVVEGTWNNGNWHLIDKSGRIVSKRPYGRIYSRTGNYYQASRDMRFVFIDTLGNEVTPLYSEIGYFSSGRALVALNGKYGYIDSTLKVVIPLKYDDAFTFQYGMGKVKLNGEYLYVDVNGVEKRINNFGSVETACNTCNSTGISCLRFATCNECSGTGNSYVTYRCSICGGDGWEKEQKRTDYVNFQTGQRFGSQLNLVKTGRMCKHCNGTGKFSLSYCTNCNGTGGSCLSSGTCPDCSGTGKVKMK